MCVVSNMMDTFRGWPDKYWQQPYIVPMVEDIYKSAKKYDEKTGQPDCELESKKDLLRKIADEFGLKINFLEKKDEQE